MHNFGVSENALFQLFFVSGLLVRCSMDNMDSLHDYYMSGFLPLFYRQV